MKKGEILYSKDGIDFLATGVKKYDNFFKKNKDSFSFSKFFAKDNTLDLSKFIREKDGKDMLHLESKGKTMYKLSTTRNNTDKRILITNLKSDGTFDSIEGTERGYYGMKDKHFDINLKESKNFNSYRVRESLDSDISTSLTITYDPYLFVENMIEEGIEENEIDWNLYNDLIDCYVSGIKSIMGNHTEIVSSGGDDEVYFEYRQTKDEIIDIIKEYTWKDDNLGSTDDRVTFTGDVYENLGESIDKCVEKRFGKIDDDNNLYNYLLAMDDSVWFEYTIYDTDPQEFEEELENKRMKESETKYFFRLCTDFGCNENLKSKDIESAKEEAKDILSEYIGKNDDDDDIIEGTIKKIRFRHSYPAAGSKDETFIEKRYKVKIRVADYR